MNTPLPNEQALVVRALTQPDAFAALYDHYAPRLYTYLRYRVESIQVAEDLTAQTFERALCHLQQYRAEAGTFSAWLFGIAHHLVSHHYRRRRFQWLSLDLFTNQIGDSPPPEELVIREETNQQLICAVMKLPERERTLIALKFAGGLTNREITAITGLSESNVGVILHRSIKQLRQELSTL